MRRIWTAKSDLKNCRFNEKRLFADFQYFSSLTDRHRKINSFQIFVVISGHSTFSKLTAESPIFIVGIFYKIRWKIIIRLVAKLIPVEKLPSLSIFISSLNNFEIKFPVILSAAQVTLKQFEPGRSMQTPSFLFQSQQSDRHGFSGEP